MPTGDVCQAGHVRVRSRSALLVAMLLVAIADRDADRGRARGRARSARPGGSRQDQGQRLDFGHSLGHQPALGVPARSL